jgi:polysaccharide biosynthesis transport protein
VTIADYLRLLRARWTTLALLASLGLLAAAAAARLQTPVYEASSQVFVSAGSGSDLGQLSQGGSFVQQRVKSYTDLVGSPALLQPVIDQLGLATTPADLAHAVHASSPLDTVLVDITVRDASPLRARDLADAVALQFPRLVARLESQGGRATSPVSVSLTRAAVTPQHPVSPRTALDLVLGLLVGLGLGVGTAVLRESLDTTVTDRSEIAGLTGAPVLGSVPDDPLGAAAPLITSDGFSPRAEAYRQVRTNIRFLSVDRRLGSLVVTGSVPGEGKTTTAANLAIALAQGGEPVLLVDADLRRPAVADLFGLPGGVGLTSVLIGDVPLESAVHLWRHDLPLEVLTAGPVPPNPSELLSSERMGELIRAYVAAGRTVIVDSPPLLPVTDAAVLARVTDGALLVVRTASTRADQVAAAAESLRTVGAGLLGVVLTRTPRHQSAYHAAYPSARAARHPVGAADPAEEAGGRLLTLEAVLAGAGGAQHGGHGLPEDLRVQRHGPVLDVVQVETHGLGPVQVGPAAHLPQPGQPRLDQQPPVHVALVPGDLGGQRGPGADE